jgi:RNA polymerase sigma-70 factor, ECF subfamily
MNNASRSSNFSRRTGAAWVGEPLPVFRRRKRNARSTPSKPARHECQSLVETRPEHQEMEAFHQMFVASRPKFIAMAQAILRNREDAEDAVQNAFVSGSTHLNNFEGRSALTTWFTRIVLNTALMIRRKRKSQWISSPPETGTPDDAGWMERIPASQPDPEMIYAQRETSDLIDGMLGKMKPTFRQALTMTYHDEMSGLEACALPGVTSATFKSRLLRARRQLLNRAQRAFDASNRQTTRACVPSRNAIQTLAARPSDASSADTSPSEAS